MSDSSSKTSSSSSARLVNAGSSPRDGDCVHPAASRWQRGRRRLSAFLRPSIESNVVALVCSGLATAVAVLLAVSVYRLHERVRVLELNCIARPSQWTQHADVPIDQVYRPMNKSINQSISSLVMM